MDDRQTAIEARVAELEQRLRAFEQRLAAIEDTSPFSARRPEPTRDASEAGLPAPAAAFDLIGVLSLAGRTFVILGGAYLLRALTESGSLAVTTGVALGFAYAMSWLVAADRTAASGRRLSATFYGVSTSILALPLLWEATTKFRVVGGTAASLILTAITLGVLAIAVRRRLQTLAWIIVFGAIASNIAFTASTGLVLPFAVASIALGIVTLWIGYTIDWVWLRWPTALHADVAVFALTAGASTHALAASAAGIAAGQWLLVTAYLVSVAVRTLVRGREVNLFEVLQTVAALAVGFGGAVYVAAATGVGGDLLAAISLLCGAGCYGVAFTFLARRQGRHHNFYFYTSLGLVLVLAGSALGLRQAPLLWAALAVLTSWAATRADRLTLLVHAAVYLVAASIGSGLLASAFVALVGPPLGQPTVSPARLLVCAAGCVCWLMPITSETAGVRVRLPRLAMAIVLSWSAAAWMVAAASSSATPPGVLATIRTGAIAITALALAWLGRTRRLREAGWLVYPLLALGAVKLLAEDLLRSAPATLFIALAFYGGALIVAPRLGQRTGD